jgi:hypothetical protein
MMAIKMRKSLRDALAGPWCPAAQLPGMLNISCLPSRRPVDPRRLYSNLIRGLRKKMESGSHGCEIALRRRGGKREILKAAPNNGVIR